MKTLQEKYNDMSMSDLIDISIADVDPSLRRRIRFIESHIIAMEYDTVEELQSLKYEINKLRYPDYDL